MLSPQLWTALGSSQHPREPTKASGEMHTALFSARLPPPPPCPALPRSPGAPPTSPPKAHSTQSALPRETDLRQEWPPISVSNTHAYLHRRDTQIWSISLKRKATESINKKRKKWRKNSNINSINSILLFKDTTQSKKGSQCFQVSFISLSHTAINHTMHMVHRTPPHHHRGKGRRQVTVSVAL